jgi:adhesin/invasin
MLLRLATAIVCSYVFFGAASRAATVYTLSVDFSGIGVSGPGSTVSFQFSAPSLVTNATTITNLTSTSLGSAFAGCVISNVQLPLPPTAGTAFTSLVMVNFAKPCTSLSFPGAAMYFFQLLNSPGVYSAYSRNGNALIGSLTITSDLVLSQRGATFRAVTGSSTVQQQAIAVASTNQVISWTTAVATVSGGNWLQASPAQGTSDPAKPPPLLTVSASAANLTPGDYYGTVTIKDVRVNAAQVLSVVLSVRPATQSPGATVAPTGLVFVAVPGSPASAQTVQVTNPTTGPLSFTVNLSGSFQSQPGTGLVSPGQPLGVTIQPGAMTAGAYPGTAIFQFSDGQSRAVGLLLIVASGATPTGNIIHPDTTATCKPTKLLPVFTLLGVNFTSPVGWPSPLEARIGDDCGAPMKTGSVSVSFSNGDAPFGLISLQQDGRWSGTWIPHSPLDKSLVATVAAQTFSPVLKGTAQLSGGAPANPTVPIVSTGGIVGTASYVASPSPGTIVSIFGLALADDVAQAANLPLPTTLQTTQVVLGGVTLPLFFVSGQQINAVVPYHLQTHANYQVIVQRAGAISVPETIAVLDGQPAVFTLDQSGKGQGHIYRITSAGAQILASPGSPVQAGDVLTIYCAGLGEVLPPLDAGLPAPLDQLENTANPATVTIGGVKAQVLFAGLTPGFAGLYQINVIVPGGVPAADTAPVIISTGGQDSVPVTIAVH